MARRSLLEHLEQIEDQTDRDLVRMTGDPDARLRLRQRAAKRRDRERFEEQAQAQTAVPLVLPGQPEENPTPPRKQRRSPDKHTVRPGTRAAVRALAVYLYFGEFKDDMKDREFGAAAHDYASSLGLPGSDLLNSEGSTMRDLAEDILEAVRLARKAGRK